MFVLTPRKEPQVIFSASNPFIMSPETPGVGGDMGLWPEQVLNPTASGHDGVYFLPGDYTARTEAGYPAGVLWPRAGGLAEKPLVYALISSPSADPAAEPHPTAREAQVTLNAFWAQDKNHIIARGLRFVGYNCLLRNTIGSIYSSCWWDNVAGGPLRIRYGAHGCRITRCFIYRSVPFNTSVDVTGIQLVDGRNINNTIDQCVILNYTDSVQTTGRVNSNGSQTSYGEVSGLTIRDNWLGFTEETHLPDGRSVLGVENCIDLKTGGVPGNPVRVTGNRMFGVRPNERTPGYAVTFHDVCKYVEMSGNRIIDCDVGMFLNAAYLNDVVGNGWQTFELKVTGNLFSGIRNNGSGLFPPKPGCVWVGPNSMTFQNNRIVDCERLAEVSKNAAAPPLMFGGNEIVGGINLGPYAEAWPDALIPGTSEDVVESVPFTNLTIRHAL